MGNIFLVVKMPFGNEAAIWDVEQRAELPDSVKLQPRDNS